MMKSIFILLLAVGYSLQNPVETEEKCKEEECLISEPSNSSVTQRQKVYYINMFFKANWYRAAQFCRYNGMQLASINSQEEQNILYQKIKDFKMEKERFWTSGTNKAQKGSFFWMSNGRPLVYTNWGPGQPDNERHESGETEDCLELFSIHAQGLQWNDLRCSYESFFICEH